MDDLSPVLKAVYERLDRHGPANLNRLADIGSGVAPLTGAERGRLKKRLSVALNRLRDRGLVESFGEKPLFWMTVAMLESETLREGAVALQGETLREQLEWCASIRREAERRRRAGAWQER